MAAFARPALLLALLAGVWWWSAPTFIPSAAPPSGSAASEGHSAALRGAPGAPAQEGGAVLRAAAPLCLALLGLAASGGARRRAAAVPRRLFGSADSARATRKATSYKEYQDPWLGSADLGFDPLNVAVGSVFDKGTAVVPETTYYNYRESEVKHGRFAMAAFLAIFFEEADRGALLNQVGIAGAADNLDGTLGLDEVQAPVLLIGLGVQALAEFSKQSKEDDGSFLSVEYNKERCPGDLGFDPLALGAGNTTQQLVELHNVEVNLGRLAMIGITSFLFKEFIVKDAGIASRIL